MGLPQVSSSFACAVRQPVTKLSPRRANTVIAPSLLSPTLSLSHSLALALSFQTTSLPKIRARFFFPHLLISTVFSLFVPSFEFLIIAFFSSGVINISIMSIITHNHIHHLRHRRDHRDHHSSRINTSLSSAGVSCAQEFFQYNCTHNLRCFFIIRVQ